MSHRPRQVDAPPGSPSDISPSAVSKNGPGQPTPGDLGAFGPLLEQWIEHITNGLAAKIVARLDGHTASPPVADRWLTPQQTASLLQRPVGYVYKHQRALGGVHLSRRVLLFSEAALRRRMERPR